MVSPAQHVVRSRHSLLRRGAPLLVSLTFCSSAFFLNGCLFRRRPAIPWAAAVQVRPTLQAHTAERDTADLGAPEINLDLAPLAALLVPVRSVPPRPHVTPAPSSAPRSEEHTSELQSPYDLVCRLLLEKKNYKNKSTTLHPSSN